MGGLPGPRGRGNAGSREVVVAGGKAHTKQAKARPAPVGPPEGGPGGPGVVGRHVGPKQVDCRDLDHVPRPQGPVRAQAAAPEAPEAYGPGPHPSGRRGARGAGIRGPRGKKDEDVGRGGGRGRGRGRPPQREKAEDGAPAGGDKGDKGKGAPGAKEGGVEGPRHRDTAAPRGGKKGGGKGRSRAPKGGGWAHRAPRWALDASQDNGQEQVGAGKHVHVLAHVEKKQRTAPKLHKVPGDQL